MKRTLPNTAALGLSCLLAIHLTWEDARAREYGYKDRIFEHNYVLPDDLTEHQVQALNTAIGLKSLAAGTYGFPSSQVLQKLGGVCAATLVLAQDSPIQNETQKEIAETNGTKGNNIKPATADFMCYTQLELFKFAFLDELSTDQQLSNLANSMQKRFIERWINLSDLKNPDIISGAKRMKHLSERFSRIEKSEMKIPENFKTEIDSLFEKKSSYEYLILLSNDREYEKLDGKLKDLEYKAAQISLENKRAKQLLEQKNAEDEEKKLIQDRKMEDDLRKLEIERSSSELKKRDDIDKLEGSIDRMSREIEYWRDRIAVDGGTSYLDTPAAYRTLNRMEKERAKLQRDLRVVRGEEIETQGTLKAENASIDCIIGLKCTVIAHSVFCRTPDQMKAILSQRPGPDRKKILDRLIGAGACRKIQSGDTLRWTSPIITIQPKGESAAELVPGILADGMSGFALKDGVFPRI